MSGFIGNDGSELIGGLNPSGVVQAFTTDALGRILSAGGYAEQAALSAGSLNALLVPVTDVSSYKAFSLQVKGAWSGTLTVQGSNDGTTWNPINSIVSDNFTVLNGSIFGNALVYGPLPCRYLRVPMTGYTSGTAQGTLELYTYDIPVLTVGALATQSSNWTMANDGTNTTAIAAAVATDTVIKNSAGRLAKILVTATGAGNTLIYDNASGHTGTVIGVIKSTASVGDVIDLKMPAANGITVAGNAANGGFTVSWT